MASTPWALAGYCASGDPIKAPVCDLNLAFAVAQPPSAVPLGFCGTPFLDFPHAAFMPYDAHSMLKPPSKFSKSAYRRNLPHIQGFDHPLFVTFRSVLPPEIPQFLRGPIMEHCLFDHRKRLTMRCAIVMPDHVHLIFWINHDSQHVPYALSEIMNGIKGASAHTVNRLLGRKGAVWQDESFDHVIRCSEKLCEKVLYIAENPIRKGLARTTRDYPWYWADPGPSNYAWQHESENTGP